jgi:putative addiction module killer protein
MKDHIYTILNAEEYDDWLETHPLKSRLQVLDRLSRIREDGHFGDHKDVEDGIWELRWKNGRRVYYAYVPEMKIILLLGGNKNGQSKDIKKAKKILNDNVTFEI